MPVTLHVWRVPRRRLGAAMLRMAFEPRRPPGVRFLKFVGTGTGVTFGLGDADLTRYAAVTVSDQPVEFPRWDRLATGRARVDLVPLTSRGTWSGQSPFDVKGRPPLGEAVDPGAVQARHVGQGLRGRTRPKGGMVLALTRARLRPSRAAVFWRAVPPVARELADAPGLLARFGFGEAPIGWQGTISLWRDAADLTRFAYRQPEHRAVIARTSAARWYAEELFARFAVTGIHGDRSVLGWLDDEVGLTREQTEV